MTYQEMTGKSIQEDFKRFHENNPHVYQIIEKEAIRIIKKGYKRISIKMVGNSIRWEKYFTTKQPTLFDPNGEKKPYKLNDAFLAHYNRMFLSNYPEHANKIELRRLRAA